MSLPFELRGLGATIEFAKWKQLLAIHLDGAFLTTRAALRQMYKRALNMDDLIKRLGADLVHVGSDIAARLRCIECDEKKASTQVLPDSYPAQGSVRPVPVRSPS